MKKQYIAPAISTMELHTECAVLAASRTENLDDTTEVGANVTLSKPHIWDADSWAPADDDDD